MNSTPKALAALTLALGMGTAAAGNHHICYQDITENGVMQVIVACQDDSGGACTITPGQTTASADRRYLRNWHPRIAMTTPFTAFQYVGPATLSFTLKFNQGQPRTCKVPYRVNGEPTGVLTGYSTDESGLITTGSWRVDAPGAKAKLRVPGDFIVTGGGFAADSGKLPRPFIRDAASNPLTNAVKVWDPVRRQMVDQFFWDSRTWNVGSKDPAGADGSLLWAEVIGLHVEGTAVDTATDLLPALKTFQAGSAGLSGAPRAVVRRVDPSLPFGEDPATDAERVIIGGDVWTSVPNGTGVGQLVTASAPESGHNRLLCLLTLNPAPCPVATPEGWSVGSLGPSFPGGVSGRILTLKPTLTIGGTTWEVRSRLVSLTSGPMQNPRASTKGLRGLYAVTGVGGQLPASVTQTRLAAVMPQLGTGGASVSTGSTAPETTRVSAAAIGVRLVKPGTPPDLEEFPVKESLAIDSEWICRVLPDLADSSSLCGVKPQTLSAKQLCASYPELQKYGYCLGR